MFLQRYYKSWDFTKEGYEELLHLMLNEITIDMIENFCKEKILAFERISQIHVNIRSIRTLINQVKIYYCLFIHPEGLYRKQIMEFLKKKERTTIYDDLNRLYKKGKIMKFERPNGKRGKPNTIWVIKENKDLKI